MKKILTVYTYDTYFLNFTSTVKILSIFVAYLENSNFTYGNSHHMDIKNS